MPEPSPSPRQCKFRRQAGRFPSHTVSTEGWDPRPPGLRCEGELSKGCIHPLGCLRVQSPLLQREEGASATIVVSSAVKAAHALAPLHPPPSLEKQFRGRCFCWRGRILG